jgi:fructose-1,6-bisphosphatase
MDMNAVPVEILSMLHDQFKSPKGLVDLLPELLSACRSIGTALRDGMFTADKTGTENPFGDQQLDVDVRSDKVDAFSSVLFQYYAARHDSNYLNTSNTSVSGDI